jgi:peroxiredoxin
MTEAPRRRTGATVGGALLLVAAMAAAYALGTQSRVTAPDLLWPEPIDRVPAPPFALPSLREPGMIALADFRGQVVVLNFFASWCAPCALEAADLQRAWHQTRGQGVVFLGVAVQDTEAEARAFLARHGVPFPAVVDRDGAVMRAYDVNGIPTTVFIDPLGRIAGRHAGIFVGDEGVARLRARIDAARVRPR